MITVRISLPNGQMIEFDALSYSHGVAMPLTCDGESRTLPAGKAVIEDMTISRNIDRYSPLLNRLCCEGKFFDEIVIRIGHSGTTVEGAEKNRFYHYILKNCCFTGVSVGSHDEFSPIETCRFYFKSIQWRYESNGETVYEVWD